MILGVALLPFPKKTAMDLGQPAGRAVLPLITRHQHGPATRIDIHKMIVKKGDGNHQDGVNIICYVISCMSYVI